ncbi:MAG TPA: phosphatase PAP2 family protein [Pseudonocardiaceae bacterium]|nr:phosphatase PAP2 family protein [Pseudonocardiaceae bacterium]
MTASGDDTGRHGASGVLAVPTRRVFVIVAAVGLLVFVLFGVLAEVPWTALRHLDAIAPADGHRLSSHAVALRTPALVITDLGSPLAVDVVTVLAAAWLLLVRRWRLAGVVLIARFGELTCESLTKLVVSRPRPHLLPMLTSGSGTSFPSGHAAGSVAAYGAILLVVAVHVGRRPSWWIVVLVAAFLFAVAASRVILGVHYPTDVLGGMALGLAWAALAFVVLTPGRPRTC